MGPNHAHLHDMADELMKQIQPHILAVAPHGMALIDTAGIVRTASPKFAEQLGYIAETIVGVHFDKVMPGWLLQMQPMLNSVRDTGECLHEPCNSYSFPDHPEKGLTFWDVRIFSCRYDDEFVGWAILQSDITERVRAQREHERLLEVSRRQNKILNMLIEQAPFAMALLEGSEFRHVVANSLYREFTDHQPLLDHKVAKILNDYVDPDATLEKVYNTGEAYHIVDRQVPDKNGDPSRYFSYTQFPLVDEDGTTEAILIMLKETTEQVLTRKRLEDEKALLSAVLDQMPAGVLIVDKSGHILMVNRKMTEIWRQDIPLGSAFDEHIAGQAFSSDGRHVHHNERPLNRALRGGETVQGLEYTLKRKDGTCVTLLVSAAPIRNRSGEIIAAVAVDEDISRRKLLEYELNQSAEERSRFLQVTAHELRNPMAALKGVCALMQRRISVGKPIDELPSLLEREIDRLSGMLTEVLEAFRAQRGELRTNHELVDLVEVLRLSLVTFLAGYQNDRFVISGLDSPIWVHGDMQRLEDVIRNLIGNAIKYSLADSHVFISLEAKGENALISVRDEGIGIPADQLTRIFSGFYRASNVSISGPSGIGLGLHICERIVNLHGGRIWAESKEGKGATFFVELPLVQKEMAQQPATKSN